MASRAVLAGLLVVLAGCSVLGGTDPVETVTPVPVPEETTERPPLPPGLSGDGVTDLDALVWAHVRATTDTSYAWTDRERRTDADGSSQVSLDRRVVFVDGTTYYWDLETRPLLERQRVDVPAGDERFADGRTVYTRAGTGGTDTYTARPATDASRRLAWVSARSLDLYLEVPDAAVSATSREGERYYRVDARRSVYVLPLGVVAYDYRARALVSPSGLVERLNVSYHTARGDGATRVSYSYAFEDIGTATLEEPAWLPRARAETTAADPAGTARPSASRVRRPAGVSPRPG